MKSKKNLKFNKSSIRLLIELLLITVSIFVLTNTSGANYVFNSLMAGAEGEEVNTDGFTISNNICRISSYNGLINFSQSYNANPSGYYNITVVEFSHTQGELQGILTGAAGFVSLGTDSYPFKADIHVADGSSLNFVADTPLFAYVYDSVKITDMNGTTSVPVTIARSSAGNTALFAENVRHLENNDTPSDWTVNIIDYKEGESLITTQYFAGVIGTIEDEAKVGLTVNSTVTGGLKVSNSGDVGLACCKMGAGSSLTVNVSGVSLYNVESTGGYAGGLVGSATDAEVIFDSAAAASIVGTVSGNNGTGGVFGYYENTQNREYGLGGYKVNCTLNGNNCGGIFGELKNSNTGTMTINNLVNGQADIDPTTAGTVIASARNNVDSGSIYGGLLGVYSANDTGNSLTISDISVSSNNGGKVTYYGGVIGQVNGAFYVKMDRVNVTASGCVTNNNITVSEAFGGLTGYINGAFIDAYNVKIESGDFAGGGVIGNMNAGVLRLSGYTDLSGTKAVGSGSIVVGQIVGNRGNQALIYSVDKDAENWVLKRSVAVDYDDIGTWGTVLRFHSNFTEDSVLSVDENAHTVTVKQTTLSGDTITVTVSSLADFAKLALNIQMNNGATSGNTLLFEDTGNISTELLKKNITLSATIENKKIDLNKTGIAGLTRDDGKAADGSTQAVYTGTFDGGGNTITLAIGEAYGQRDGRDIPETDIMVAGNGAVLRHCFNGLFARTKGDIITSEMSEEVRKERKGATFKNLTIDGYINVAYRDTNKYYYIGGLSGCHVLGCFTAENVTVDETIRHSGEDGSYHFAGGMIGANDSETTGNRTENINLYFSGCNIKTIIEDNSSRNNFICGGALGEIGSTKVIEIVANDVTIGAQVTNNNTKDGRKNGGFIGNIANYRDTLNTAENKNRKIKLTNITINGAAVTTKTLNNNSGATNKGGALLGEAWNNMEVTIGGEGENEKGIHVISGTVTSSGGNGAMAGLVTAATGYWKVYDIRIDSITVEAPKARSFGMIVNKGYFNDWSKNYAIYLELQSENAYKITNASLNLKNDVFFDELVTTCSGNYNNSSSVMDNGKCGIVSIHTTGGMVYMDGSRCNTYQNQTGRDISNCNTRYYYNLDVMRGKAAADLSPAEKLMLWSVNCYAFANIKDYFLNPFGNSNNIPEGVYDMTGYSYYPIDLGSSVTMSGCEFIFCNKNIDVGENVSVENGNTDSKARTTSAKNSQHYLMHCGLFKNVSSNLTAANIKLTGDVGKVNDYCGALVCGQIMGNDVQQPIKVTIDGMTLNGIKLTGELGTYAPLLIKSINSNTTFTLKNVSTSNAYESGATVATSLMGSVGSKTSSNIKLTFSRIKLDARTNASDDTAFNSAYNTTKSIFNKATLLDSLTYTEGSNCNAVYNYKYGEDWGEEGNAVHNVTYGQEISASAEYKTGEMGYDVQEKYIDSSNYTDPNDPNHSASPAYDFTQGFLKYVATGYNSKNCTHEIKINHKSIVHLDKGCGTYNDPYIIYLPAQLKLVADMLDSDPTIEEGVVINYKSATNYKDWCTENKSSHTALTWDTANFVSADGKTTKSLDDVRNSLATAYYMLESKGDTTDPNVTEGTTDKFALPNTFIGIGKAIPFKGVIYGSGRTIENQSTNPFIYQSKGAVIKDLTIEVTADFTGKLRSDANSTYLTDDKGTAEFYGGLIGIVNGGDNIIDKVSVTIAKADTIKPENGSCYGNKAVGGYIGVLRYGAVIFRNMDGSDHVGIDPVANARFAPNEYTYTDKNGNKTQQILLYFNPIIGRVIDGFAVTESTSYKAREAEVTMKNGTKNYSIADIDVTDTNCLQLSDLYSITDTREQTSFVNTVTVPNSQGLFLMGCITMSGAGKYNVWNNAYVKGDGDLGYGNGQMTRHGNYSEIGTTEETSADFNTVTAFDKFAREGVGNSTFDNNKDTNSSVIKEVVPYIIYKYTTSQVNVTKTPKDSSKNDLSGICNYPARTLTSNGSVFDIVLTAGETYDLPDGFRGIGSLNSSKDSNQMFIYGIKGNGCTVKLNMNFYKYRKDYDRYYNINGDKTFRVGLGLFNTLMQNRYDLLVQNTNIDSLIKDLTNSYKVFYEISDLTISGTVNSLSYNSEVSSTINNSEVISNINYDDVNSCAGGLAGACSTNNGSSHVYYADIKNVTLKDLKVSGTHVAGGLIGSVRKNSGNQNVSVKLTKCSAENLSVGNGELNGGCYTGGLIGFVRNCNLVISSSPETTKTNFAFNRIASKSGRTDYNDDNQKGVGGLIGTVYDGCNASINNMEIVGNTIEANLDANRFSDVGGVIGYSRGNKQITIDNVDVKVNSISGKESTSGGSCSGGIIGRVSSSTTIAITNCNIIGSADSVICGSEKAGGLVGFAKGNISVDNCRVMNSKIKVTSTNYQYNNSGGFVGWSEANISLKNSMVENCTVQSVDVADKSAGGIVGYCSSGYIKGYNILSNNVQITNAAGAALTTAETGDIAGKVNSNGTVNLVGVCVQKADGGIYARTAIGKKSGSAYVIYADYNGSCIGDAANKAVSSVNSSNPLAPVEFPYATVNPKSDIDTTQFLTGDGANISAVNNIIRDAGSPIGYNNMSSEDKSALAGFKGKITTFNDRTDAGLTCNFPVLVLNESNYSTITGMINSYIHHLTNDSTISNYAASDSRYKVDISSFRLNDSGQFEQITEQQSITLTTAYGQYFKMTDNDYDSNHIQFTLIDVQYYDPTTTNSKNVVYHLYIPVYVEKMLNFNFRIGALSGTKYKASDYKDGLPVLENYGTPVTAHITYSYLRTLSEWEKAINGGENVLQGYGKSIVISNTAELPTDTKLVLVDKNCGGKAYYSTFGDVYSSINNTLDFSKFKTSGDDSFSPISFFDLLSSSVDITISADSKGMLVKCSDTESAQATLQINGEYYRKKTDSDTDTTYSVKLTSDIGEDEILKVDEEYYISFFTAADENAPIRNMILSCNSRLGDTNMTPSHLNSTATAEEREKRSVHMILGNIYVQELSFKTTGENVISEQNNAINAEISTTISLKDDGSIKSYFSDESIHLYHSFIIEATTTDEGVNEKGIKGNPLLSGKYTINGTEYSTSLTYTGSVIQIAGNGENGIVDIKKLLKDGPVTITCNELTITYPGSESIIAQFPLRKNSADDSTGVKYSASSNLAYVADNIEHSNMSNSMSDANDRSYYRENISSASLSYNIPTTSANDLTALGINGREANDKINAVAYYNVQNIAETDREKAKLIQFTLSLYQKNNEGQYVKVNIAKNNGEPNYLEEIRLYDKDGKELIGVPNSESQIIIFNKFDKDLLKYDNGLFEIPTSFYVNTGATFEADGFTYANYKAELTAQLFDVDGNPIANTECSDYIIYTNAKICTEMVAAS